jgi:hypothetical protein
MGQKPGAQMGAVLSLLAGLAMTPAAPLRPPATAAEAVAKQRQQLRRAIGYDCSAGSGSEDIVVCGRLDNDDYVASPADRGRRFEPAAPGPLFEFHSGPLSISCCSIATRSGSGAGLSLKIRF